MLIITFNVNDNDFNMLMCLNNYIRYNPPTYTI